MIPLRRAFFVNKLYIPPDSGDFVKKSTFRGLREIIVPYIVLKSNRKSGLFLHKPLYFLPGDYCSLSLMICPMRTPMMDAIMSPLVQPLESPRQWSDLMFVLNSVSILILLE